MAFEEITAPPILDETGQDIVAALLSIADKTDSSRSTLRTVPFSIPVSDWTLTNGEYKTTFLSEYITTTSKEFYAFNGSYRSFARDDFDVDKKDGGAGFVFTTPVIPTGTISGFVYVFDADDGKVPIIVEDTVIPIINGGTGAATASAARDNIGLGDAAVKNVANGITSSDTGLPTASQVRSAMDLEHSAQIGTTEGHNLKEIFGTPAAMFAAVKTGDFSKIHNGDYWPVTLNGTYHDYAANADKTFTNALVKVGVNINHYFRYGDSGAITGAVNNLLFSSLDLLPVTLQYRSENSTWYDETKDNPWLGSHLYQTMNNASNGIIKLLLATELGPYIYTGPNGAGMRSLMETKAKGATATSGWGWKDRGILFLPTEQEVWGHTIFADTQYHSKGCCLQWPQFIGSRRYLVKGLGDGGSRRAWWCESSVAGNAATFCIVNYGGAPYYYDASGAFGVPLCFLAFDPS